MEHMQNSNSEEKEKEEKLEEGEKEMLMPVTLEDPETGEEYDIEIPLEEVSPNEIVGADSPNEKIGEVRVDAVEVDTATGERTPVELCGDVVRSTVNDALGRSSWGYSRQYAESHDRIFRKNEEN